MINKYKPDFAIIVPLQEESNYYAQNITNKRKVTIAGIQYILGEIAGRPIVLVNSGLGKINASIITTRVISDFNPTVLILSGSSGNINPAITKDQVVVGKTVLNADFGRLTKNGTAFEYDNYLLHPQSNKTQPLVFNLSDAVMGFIKQLKTINAQPKIVLGTIATSDALPNPGDQINLLQESGVDVVDMESVAIMQAGWFFNASCIIVRGVSNNANEEITQQDIQTSADDAAKVVMSIVANYPFL